MPHLDPGHTFVITDASNAGSLVVRPLDEIAVEDFLCGTSKPESPVVFGPNVGHKAYDLLPTSHARLYLISERFKSALVKHGFTGWETYSVEVYGSNGKLVPNYFGWSITGRCGLIDEKKGAPAIVRPKSIGARPIPMLRGLQFDPESWDGSDIFLSPGWGYKFCTERVAEAISKEVLTNVKLTRASEHLRPNF